MLFCADAAPCNFSRGPQFSAAVHHHQPHHEVMRWLLPRTKRDANKCKMQSERKKPTASRFLFWYRLPHRPPC